MFLITFPFHLISLERNWTNITSNQKKNTVFPGFSAALGVPLSEFFENFCPYLDTFESNVEHTLDDKQLNEAEHKLML